MIATDDPDLPGLSRLCPKALRRITGAKTVSLARLRYRPGRRAILHVETGAGGQGALWFFEGGKGRRLAKRNGAAVYDTETGALYEPFPNDHRMPQIREFLDRFDTIAPPLLGGAPDGMPEVLRYRPGLSCTFRCGVAQGGPVYVKLISGEKPERLAAMNRRISEGLRGEPVFVARAVGTDAGLSAIAYAGARGRPLDATLAQSEGIQPIRQGIDALSRFWELKITPERRMTGANLTARAAESVAMVAATVPEALPVAERVFARVDGHVPSLECCPIHGDVKLEHLFLDGGETTLIDIESVSLGPPDHDLAQLYGRIWMDELEGLLPEPRAARAAEEVRRAAGPGFEWCRDVVALRLAKYFAQRPAPEAPRRIAAILERMG